MPKARKRASIGGGDKVRRIRQRYYEALSLGHAIPEAARLAEDLSAEIPRAASAAAKVNTQATSSERSEPERPAEKVSQEPAQTVQVGGETQAPPEVTAQTPAMPAAEKQLLRDRIPPKFQELPYAQLRELAMEVSGGKTPKSRAEASKWVEDFLAT